MSTTVDGSSIEQPPAEGSCLFGALFSMKLGGFLTSSSIQTHTLKILEQNFSKQSKNCLVGGSRIDLKMNQNQFVVKHTYFISSRKYLTTNIEKGGGCEGHDGGCPIFTK